MKYCPPTALERVAPSRTGADAMRIRSCRVEVGKNCRSLIGPTAKHGTIFDQDGRLNGSTLFPFSSSRPAFKASGRTAELAAVVLVSNNEDNGAELSDVKTQETTIAPSVLAVRVLATFLAGASLEFCNSQLLNSMHTKSRVTAQKPRRPLFLLCECRLDGTSDETHIFCSGTILFDCYIIITLVEVVGFALFARIFACAGVPTPFDNPVAVCRVSAIVRLCPLHTDRLAKRWSSQYR